MDLVDEEYRLLVVFDLLHHLLEALLEIAAITRTCEQGAHIERKDRRIGEHFRHFVLDDLAGETFGDRRLADARIADEQRIVLVATAKDLDGAHDLGVATDQGIDAPFAGFLVEVHAIGIERTFLFLRVRPGPCLLPHGSLPHRHRAASSRDRRGQAVWRCHG